MPYAIHRHQRLPSRATKRPTPPRPSARQRWAARGCLLAPLTLAACGDAGSSFDELDLGIGQAAIADGTVDADNSAVVAVLAQDSRSLGLCSGTLIAPNLVLTARHCVAAVTEATLDCSASDATEEFLPRNLTVSPATNLLDRALFFPVAKVLIPGDSALCGADIALLILDGQFREEAIQPLAPRLSAPALRGESVSAIGYGETLQVDDGSGLRRIQDDLLVVCDADGCGFPDQVFSREFLSNGGVCSGDSGGPALDELGQVVGVASRGTADCGLSIYSSVWAWSDWLVEGALEAFASGDYPLPQWLADSSGEGASAEDNPVAPPAESPTQQPATAGAPADDEPSPDEATAAASNALGETNAAPEIDGAPGEARLSRAASGGCSLSRNSPHPTQSSGPLLAACLAALVWLRRRSHRPSVPVCPSH